MHGKGCQRGRRSAIAIFVVQASRPIWTSNIWVPLHIMVHDSGLPVQLKPWHCQNQLHRQHSNRPAHHGGGCKRGVPTCMELGGKSCLIVFDDVNIDNAVEWATVSTLALDILESNVYLKGPGLSTAHEVLISVPYHRQIACRIPQGLL